jgi:aconitate hydratase
MRQRGKSVAVQLIESHLIEGKLDPGTEIGLRIDQTLTQDATGTLVMLELEAMGLDRVRTEVSVQYVDHNIIQADFKNPDDHLFLRSACQRFGVWYSPPGNGVSHPVHQERFGKPGKILLGSDSHTCSAGAIGMLAIGTGGLEVALAMAGEPYYVEMPEIWGVELTGSLPDWVSAKDIILEMLRRHGVSGGIGRIIEYYGPGLVGLSAMDRHVIANMGAELGATTTVFPSDQCVREFLNRQDRAADWIELVAEPDAHYDHHEHIELGQLEPLIAMPSSPGNVQPVREVAGAEIYQVYIGSSANPGYRDFAMAALMLAGSHVHERVSFDINPASRQVLMDLIQDGHLASLIAAGGRLHQAGCNGCIGMGQAPAFGKLSLRTVPRNFPGRSGTIEDKVCLVSPETAVASARTGVITDPRTLDIAYPHVSEPARPWRRALNVEFIAPLAPERARMVELYKGPNIKTLPKLDPLPDRLVLPVLLDLGDNISTDEILPAGVKVLPLRSNIPAISEFVFATIDQTYTQRARATGDHAIVAGCNYGQGSSREHAALAPRTLGLRAVLAMGFARIHRHNLVNFGVLPLEFVDPADYEHMHAGARLVIDNLREQIATSQEVAVQEVSRTGELEPIRVIRTRHRLSGRQVEIMLVGGLIEWMRGRLVPQG